MTNSYPTRREALACLGAGFGSLALTELLAREVSANTKHPLAVREPHHPPRAKRCIFLYMPGGPSQIDLFDPKPMVTANHGKPLPFPKPKLEHVKTGNLMASKWKFKRHGDAGTEVSELLPHLAQRVDDICVVRSMVADNINHSGAALQINTGAEAFSHPSMGAWLLYGLGTENENLPGFIVVSPAVVFQGAPLWSSSFLPSAYQGTCITDLDNPIKNLNSPTGDLKRQRRKLDAIRRLNELHKNDRQLDSLLDARIASFELAFRMQREAPGAFDTSRESEHTKNLYGIGNPTTDLFGRQCLLARRLVERGVRYVQLFDAPQNNAWDHHGGIPAKLPGRCAAVDQPIAALLADLKQRGMLDETLVVWGGEFGRTPTVEGKDGRGHHPFGFTMWLAGGGIRGGMTYGATDDFGWYAVENKVHVHDLHATILHLMGLDHEKLTFHHSGRDYRLTDVYGSVVQPILR